MKSFLSCTILLGLFVLHTVSEVITYSLRYVWGFDHPNHISKAGRTGAMFLQCVVNMSCFAYALGFFALYSYPFDDRRKNFLEPEPNRTNQPAIRVAVISPHIFSLVAFGILIFMNMITILMTNFKESIAVIQFFLNFFGYGFQLLVCTLRFPKPKPDHSEIDDSVLVKVPKVLLNGHALMLAFFFLYLMVLLLLNIGISTGSTTGTVAFLQNQTENILLLLMMNSWMKQRAILFKHRVSQSALFRLRFFSARAEQSYAYEVLRSTRLPALQLPKADPKEHVVTQEQAERQLRPRRIARNANEELDHTRNAEIAAEYLALLDLVGRVTIEQLARLHRMTVQPGKEDKPLLRCLYTRFPDYFARIEDHLNKEFNEDVQPETQYE